MFSIADLTLKPIVADEKSDQQKVSITKTLFSNPLEQNLLQLKTNSIGTWTIEKEERCNICWINIKMGEEFTSCASCNNKFHTEHWRQWIIAKGTCPICKVKPR